MKQMPNKIKDKLRKIHTYYKKIGLLQEEIDEYFESKGLEMDNSETFYENTNSGKDNVLIYTYNGANNTDEELEESINEIEQIFLDKVNNKKECDD